MGGEEKHRDVLVKGTLFSDGGRKILESEFILLKAMHFVKIS
jgi:hypothetical protein